MSDTAAAIRSAKEVSAETVAPELYRQATEWFFKARNEFKMKNYKYAREYAVKARHYAEQAEFEALRSGANRTEASLSDPYAGEAAPPPPKTEPAPQKPYAYPTPEPTAAKDGDMPPEPTPLPPAPH